MNELFHMLCTLKPINELERVAWRVRAAQHLIEAGKDPFRDHTNQLRTIELLAVEYNLDYKDEMFQKGVRFMGSVTNKGYTNDEITRRAVGFSPSTSG